VADLKKANPIIARRKETDTRTTEDAAEINNVMLKCAVMDTGATRAAAERKLWRKMKDVFS
jgi:hypothetical protein